MGYTEDLIKEVYAVYPDSPEMHRLARDGNAFLGRYLDDSCGGGIPLDTVLLALNLEELQVKARLAKRKINLYRKWYEQDPRKN